MPNRFSVASTSENPPGVFGLERSLGVVRIKVKQDFDLRCVRLVATALSSTIYGGGAVDEVLLDLSSCSFIDSSGLRMILELERQSRRHGYTFAVMPGAGQVERVLELSGVGRAVTLLS